MSSDLNVKTQGLWQGHPGSECQGQCCRAVKVNLKTLHQYWHNMDCNIYSHSKEPDQRIMHNKL